jgi:hypothetical protein
VNADLALYLIEQGIPLDKAKVIAAEAVSNADIAFGVLEALPGAFTVAEAKVIAAEAPLVVDMASGKAEPSRYDSPPIVAVEGTEERARVLRVPVLGPDGLTDIQRDAVGTVGLCPNCQQPKNRHLPACARASGEDPTARTKGRLPPAV